MRMAAAKSAVLVSSMVVLVWVGGSTQGQERTVDLAETQLGARLFSDDRFCSPKGDLRNSCSSCHMSDQSPEGPRAYTDFLTRSWVPWRTGDPRRDGVRNAPTILDLSDAPRLHYDGEFTSLEGLAKGTLTGRSMGWLAAEESEAMDHFYKAILADKREGSGPSYSEEFKSAYDCEITGLDSRRVVELASKSLAAYMRTLKSGRNTPYDQFIKANELPAGPEGKEKPREFAARLLARLSSMERAGQLNTTAAFGQKAVDGLKVFMRTEGDAAGNCATCHVPPLFTDFSFHNIGISQAEYDSVHGMGSFARLPIPDGARAARPSVQFKETARSEKPGYADLGYWNFVSLGGPDSLAGEKPADLLRRMIGAMKTPTLRNLAYSFPYMHNGVYPTLEDALGEIIDMSQLSRDGKVRSADPELPRITITGADTARLEAFLNTLNDDLDHQHHSKH